MNNVQKRKPMPPSIIKLTTSSSRYHCLSARFILLVLLVGAFHAMNAQQTVLYQDAEKDFQSMLKEFDQGLYGRAARSAEKFLNLYHEHPFEDLRMEAELYQLKSWLRIDYPSTIGRVMNFVNEHQPDAYAQQALMMVGEYAYEQKRYDDAIQYLSMVNPTAIPVVDRSALSFKLGYSFFVKEEFDKASTFFNESRNARDKYYYPSNYYYGVTKYFQGNYDEAISSFELVAPSEFYKDFIPYYITQIHFNNKDYTQVIGYGNHALSNPSVQNKREIRHLIGQAYFETGDYAAAIPHLEYVEQNTEKLHPDDFFQLGMAYYESQRYSEAIPVFLEVRNEPGVKGHYANYYLGQAYLKTGDKTSARNSLRNAMVLEEVPSLSTEAAFHYGRLSAEAGDDNEAIRVLQTIPSTSPDYSAAQKNLADILINTGDFSLAIEKLEDMSSMTPVMKEAYQKVTLFRAEQLIQEGKYDEANAMLDKSLKNTPNKSIEARGLFWKGELAHDQEKYNESIQRYGQYFAIASNLNDLPLHQSLAIAHYNQGYNYLFLSDFAEAQKHFESSLSQASRIPISQDASFIKNQLIPDALLRAGDAAFKRNQYEKAIERYDQSIDKKYAGHDYAKYQKALIKGLQKKPFEKIALLEEIANNIPQSLWADDALLQAGITYQEENQSAKAIASYERIVNLKPRSALLHPALLRLGLVNYNNGQYDAALKYYQSIFQYNPDPQTSKEAMAAIQEIYVNELDKPEAFFDFAGTIPGYTVSGSERDSILYAAAENHYAQGSYDKAAESFQHYIDKNPKGIYALKAKFLKAESLSLAKKWEAALTAYETVIKEGQSTYLPPALYKAAIIAYNERQDMARAFKYYSDYIPLAESPELQYESTLGVLRSAYKLKSADDVYMMSSKIIDHPRSTDDVRSLAHYYSASLALEKNEYDRAIKSYNEVIRLSSAELAAEARYSIASIYEKRGQTDLAEKLAEESARANVGYPFWVAKSLLLLSDIHFRKDDLLNAKAIVEAILENFQGDETIVKEASTRLDIITEAEKNQSRIRKDDNLELQDPKKDK